MTANIKDIREATDAINLHCAEAEKIKGDIERAREAVQEAEGFQAQIDAVSRKRAEAKAHAFVEGKKADTKELDKQEAELERASRQAREDAAAAVLAIELLQDKLTRVQAEIAALNDNRRLMATRWLLERSEKAVDRYLKALLDLGPIIAEAKAADRLRKKLGENTHCYGEWLAAELRKIVIPVPYNRMEHNRYGATTPITWLRDIAHGDAEYAQLDAELKNAGVH